MTGSALRLLTVTWSGDRPHFELLRESLARSPLAGCRHDVVVQSEDGGLFTEFDQEPVRLLDSADVLPAGVEVRRRQARRWQARLGRRATTLAGSMARRLGWPRWPRYTGWHTQQLCKLAVAAASEVDTVVALDSDLIVTPYASSEDFLHGGGAPVCFHDWQPAEALSTKVRHWQRNAHALLDLPRPASGPFDCYYDTPFVFYAPAVRDMLAWLEHRYQRPWWQTLLAQPPRRWSEFGLYPQFLRHYYDGPVDWRDRGQIGYLFDASNPDRVVNEFRRLVHEMGCHYVTIHSQASGRQSWHPDNYREGVRQVLERKLEA